MITIIPAQRKEGTRKKILFNSYQIKPFFRDNNFLFNIHNFRTRQSQTKKPLYSAYITEVIHSVDPRIGDFGPAKKKEIQSLIKRGTWKVVLKEEVPEGADILGSRFIITIKDAGTDREICKARLKDTETN